MHEGFVVWFTSLSGSGKTTLAMAIEEELHAHGVRYVQRLDGDVVRQDLTRDLGFSKEDRDENIHRVTFVAELLSKNGVATTCSFISPYRKARATAREQCHNFIEVYYQGVERERVDSLLSLLEEGRDLALVSDAGTPLISDPGYPLVRAAIKAGVVVIPIPGPTAAITALVSSGLATDHFAFDGAIPRKEGERRAYFERVRSERRTIIVHESPHRLLSTLETIAEVLPDRTIALARELTKVHEEFLRGNPGEILEVLRARGEIKGECVLLIAGNREPSLPHDHEAAKRLVVLLKEEGISKKVAVKILIEALDLPRNEAYRLIHPSP